MLCHKLFIEAVTVCIHYADYLAEVMPFNLAQVDLWTVVTTPEDKDTQELCRRYGVRCLRTDVFNRDVEPPRFNKSRGVNYGLAHLAATGWVLHLDADVVLPPQFRRMAENAELDPLSIYGMDRVSCVGPAEWDDFKASPELQYEWSYLVKPPRGWRLCTRVTHGDYGGYCPIGYFQLWNPKESGVDRYPIKQDASMEHSDLLHSIQWPRRRRVLIPEGFCIHLETPGRQFSSNWNGRITPPFREPKAPGMPVSKDHPASYS